MERLQKRRTYQKNYGPVVLYLEDLQRVVEALPQPITIYNDEYRFESLDEAKEYFGTRPQYQLKIGGVSPVWQLELDRHKAEVFIAQDPDAARIFHELDDIVAPRQRKPAFVYSRWGFVFFAVLIFLPMFLSASYPIRDWVLPATAVLGLCWVFIVFIQMRWHSVIYFQRRIEQKSFIERNRDQIMLMVISAVVGGLFTFAGTQLKDKLFHPPPATYSK